MKQPRKRSKNGRATPKQEALAPFKAPVDGPMTSDHGVPIAHTDDSLKVGPNGPTLLEDFHLREKIMHFDHERIPERVVHARGSGAHGFFQVYEPLTDLTRAAFLQDPSVKTPVFVRFSTVQGSRGSADTARDVRGFATKFYTQEGNFDLVGNNIPVFFIQDGIKFPDLVHAIKPEPASEIPGASSAHDSFWDFISLQPETAHMILWLMSDRTIPRAYSMMEGFGVHTFRLVNEAGQARPVKFHWKPLLGAHSLTWDESQKLMGIDADFHRRDLFEAIERGDYPEFELGIQVIEDEVAARLGFDLRDATKIVPEEVVPVRRVGKMTLDRNPDNFFAEVEQVAFCIANLVPGIDITDDPLLAARLFSYPDTQITRLGGPNFAEIPINRPLVPVRNHQQDGFMRQKISTAKANYNPNSIGNNEPAVSPEGYVHSPARVSGEKVRMRSPSFADHFTQARLFYDSLSVPEREHLIEAFHFELGKVGRKEIREREVALLAKIDVELAQRVAERIGVAGPSSKTKARPQKKTKGVATSPALSLENQPRESIQGRRIAVLIADGVAEDELAAVRSAIENAGGLCETIAWAVGPVVTDKGGSVEALKSALVAKSVLYDAVYVPGGEKSVLGLLDSGEAVKFVHEAFWHCKPIGASSDGVRLLDAAGLAGVELAPEGVKGRVIVDKGVVTARGSASAKFLAAKLIDAIAAHRHWEREATGMKEKRKVA